MDELVEFWTNPSMFRVWFLCKALGVSAERQKGKTQICVRFYYDFVLKSETNKQFNMIAFVNWEQKTRMLQTLLTMARLLAFSFSFPSLGFFLNSFIPFSTYQQSLSDGTAKSNMLFFMLTKNKQQQQKTTNDVVVFTIDLASKFCLRQNNNFYYTQVKKNKFFS